MKKSKIIVPAMAMIAFTSLASIAGSVAWFTASRQANVSAGSYAVVKTTTNLLCTVADGVGTDADNATKTIALRDPNNTEHENKLTDGSFNHVSKKIYQPNDAGDGLAGTNGEVALSNDISDLESKLERAELDNGGKVYTAVTWDLSFTISFGATSGDYGLYVNNAGTTFATTENTDSDDGTVDTTAKGFRIAVVPKVGASVPLNSSTRSVVIAKLQEFAECSYIYDSSATGSTFTDGTAYTAANKDIIASNTTTAGLPSESDVRTDAVGLSSYIGTFGYKASSQVTLSYTVVAWFEGTDPEIRNRDLAEEYQTVVATLSFEAVKLKNAGTSTITFNANGGSGTMADLTLTNGAGQIPASTFTPPTGKHLDHWNTAEDDSGEDFDKNYTFTSQNSNLTLYAIWVND